MVYTDLNGPPNTISYCCEKYFVTFIDDYSKYAKIYCIKNKSETASCFFDYINLDENQLNKRDKTLQCDNGKYYLNEEIYDFIR